MAEGTGIRSQNWIIHKQIWAVEHPDKFYDGNVDFGWQKRNWKQKKDKDIVDKQVQI